MAKETIRIEVERKGGVLGLKIDLPNRLEEFFENMSEGRTDQSSVWFLADTREGAEFYQLTEEYEDLEREINEGLQVFNDYGVGLVRDEAINLATLRTKGAKDGVVLTSEKFGKMMNADFEYYVRALAEAGKRLYESLVVDKTLKATITYEV